MYILVLTLPIVIKRVVMGSLEHWLPIVFALLLGLVAIHYARKGLSTKNQYRLIHFIAIGVSLVVIGFHLHKIICHPFEVKQ